MKVFLDCHVMCGDVNKFIAHHLIGNYIKNILAATKQL